MVLIKQFKKIIASLILIDCNCI